MDQSDLTEARLSGKVGEQLGEWLQKGQGYASQLGSQAHAQLRERPFVAVAGALALGFVIGAILSRRRS